MAQSMKKKLINRFFEWAANKLGYGHIIYPKFEYIKSEMNLVEVSGEYRFPMGIVPQQKRFEIAFNTCIPELMKLATVTERTSEPWEARTMYQNSTVTRITLYVGVKK